MILPYFFASFQWSLSSLQVVFSLLSVFPHTNLLQGLEGFPTGSALPESGVRDSPVQQCMCGCFTTWWDKKWVLLPQAGHEVCLACSPGTMCPTYAGFSLNLAVGAGSSWWQLVHLPSGTLCSCSLHIRLCPCHALTLWPWDLYGGPVPLTATTPLPTFSVLATQRYDKFSGHPGDKEAIRRWKRGQQMWILVPSCYLWALIFRQINLSKPQPFLMQNGSERV